MERPRSDPPMHGEKPYSVGEITEMIKKSLEAGFRNVRIEGEISNFRPASSGHLYFTLKDNSAVIQAVMFRGHASGLGFTPADGQLVIARGNISVYAKRGNYQIICDSLTRSGEGNILAMLEERKRKLAAEGLFDEARKRPIPLFPFRVAVVTSPTGAAVRDILRVLKRRNSGLNLIILPAPVQGDEAAPRIAEQIRRAGVFDLAEVLIIGRGGGSLEDLLPFSEEIVVRAVAESPIPVISAVGHEIDTALSDLAADLRAPTPSAAAEVVSASRDELILKVRETRNLLEKTLRRRTEHVRILLKQFTPERLERAFQVLIQPFLLRLDDCKEGLLDGMSDRIVESRHRIAVDIEKLKAGSPKEILKRGYAFVQDRETGKTITRAGATAEGKGVRVRFLTDALDAEVKEIRDEKL
ncbi:MAG: exodeoxyribonuclease VII large subunit [Spirochaetia bacterium]